VDDLLTVADAFALDTVIPVAPDAGGPAAVKFALRHPSRNAAMALLSSFCASAPDLRLPELIRLFAIPSLRPLSQHFLQHPALSPNCRSSSAHSSALRWPAQSRPGTTNSSAR
jgi:pimeloyl-ACP methyl ester carboxylesterase